MIYRKLGRTGEQVSVIGLGGYHLGCAKDVNEAVRIVRSAIAGIIMLAKVSGVWVQHCGTVIGTRYF